ncbi:hypothetical protein E3P81_03487 [Wallemia ichthyophaga]|nr:hypothetical protein E3P97_03524 [Wallemia ichthyophaga]TIB44503.1 hypothetical protein E3P82_03492 [Wallemia ichthyophaga]TIB46938.1 hypothetical protein E3P81_03487 [Wallemia ichthyophaga]TIB49783.1 hypothetical protein E3P80_03496 [Wallemia ichthyophaga]TIB56400.1 hypothetical protein E3P79_03489 [Wallemia ichthyophaga]
MHFCLNIWESISMVSFLYLLIQYIGNTTQDQRDFLEQKGKSALPMFKWVRFRASKPYFMYTLKWGVLQYAILRPLLSIISIICEAENVLCSTTYSVHFAEVYITAIDFVSISVALYALVIFYTITKADLMGKKPLAKFLSIKLLVAFTFYQGFIFDQLAEHNILKSTEYWTRNNISNGLDSLCICVEMVFFSAFMIYAFSFKEYRNRTKVEGVQRIMNPLMAFLYAINLTDLIKDVFLSFRFFFDYARNKPYAHSKKNATMADEFDEAFLPSSRGYEMTRASHEYDDHLENQAWHYKNDSTSTIDVSNDIPTGAYEPRIVN